MTKGVKSCVSKVIVLVAACCASLMAGQPTEGTSLSRVHPRHPELARADQSCVVFKVIDGAKYPAMVLVDPAVYQIQVVLGGTEQDGSIGLVKKADDLKNMVPLRYTVKNADSGVQIDKKYDGCREAYVGIALEYFFKAVNLMPSDGYKGVMLVDEYKAGKPQKWVFSNLEQLRGIKAYMLRKFAELNVIAPEKKPLLLLEILNGDTKFTDDDITFLNTYFDVLDRDDARVVSFFKAVQSMHSDILDKTKDAKNVMESMGELLMRKMESASGDFEGKKVVAILLGFIVGGIVIKLVADLISKNCDKVLIQVGLKDKGPRPVTGDDIVRVEARLAKLGERFDAHINPGKPAANPA